MTIAPSEDSDQPQICPVWSASSLSAWRNIGSSATHWAHCKDSDQTGQMPRLIWLFTVRTCNFVGYVMRHIVGLQRFIALSHYNHLSIILIWMKWCWKENSPNHLSINHLQLDWNINYYKYKFWTIINIHIYIYLKLHVTNISNTKVFGCLMFNIFNLVCHKTISIRARVFFLSPIQYFVIYPYNGYVPALQSLKIHSTNTRPVSWISEQIWNRRISFIFQFIYVM